MKVKEFELLMTEIKELKDDVKEVRQTDVPGVHTRIAVLEEKMKVMKENISKETDRKAKIYGGVGGALAVVGMLLKDYFSK